MKGALISTNPIPTPGRFDGGHQRPRLTLGGISIDAVTFQQALARIHELVLAGRGGMVFTPNVDHVVKAETDGAFRAAYDAASLVLADGMPILWASRCLGHPLPERIAGADLLRPVAEVAARNGWRVYLLGGAPGVAAQVGARLYADLGLVVAGVDAPRIEVRPTAEEEFAIQRLIDARPHLVLVALGTPKQEIWIHRVAARLRPAVLVGVGAGFDFIAGRIRRAPRWVSGIGLEWLFRLTLEPRRLWRRYLLEDPGFVGILIQALRASRSDARHARSD